MKPRFRILIAVLFGLVHSQSILAQSEDEIDGEVQDAEIVIEKERKIELKSQRKLYEFIKWKPETTEKIEAPDKIQWFDLKEQSRAIEIEPARTETTDSTRIYDHFVKAGYGNYGSPLLNVDLTKRFNDDQFLGLRLRHRSFASGAIDDENSGNAVTAVRLYGAVSNDKLAFTSALDYQAERNYYFGYPAGTIVERQDIRHAANFIDLGAALYSIDPKGLIQFGGQLNYRSYADNFRAEEDILAGRGWAHYQETFYLETEFMLSKYKDTGIDESRNYIRINPYYRWKSGDLVLDVGFSLSAQNDDYPDLNSQKLFPYANATYGLNEDYSLFAKLDGGYTVNTLFDMAGDVGVLNQSLVLANAERLADISGGIKGSPTSGLSFTAGISYQAVRYLPILVNNATDQSRLDVIYDVEVSRIITFSGEVNYLVSDAHELSAGINLFSYSSDGYDQIFHRPTSMLRIAGQHQLLSALRANWQLSMVGGIVARDLQLTDPNFALDTITQLDIEFHYQINKNWGAFLSGENLLNQEFERYLNYPQRGILVRAGATFRL